MIPWAHFRRTYGAEIASRELVRRRIGRLSALIVGCDALVQWCAGLLDQGYRGEMECIIAKIFGSEAQKEAAVDLFMKTHGGRSFLEGHMFGDNVHEFLAPCIYEGEGEMLGMAFFKSLVKQHGMKFFEPIGKALAAAGIKKPNPLNPRHAWALRKAAPPYVRWLVGRRFHRPRRLDLRSAGLMPEEKGWPPRDSLSKFEKTMRRHFVPPALESHSQFAADWLQRSALAIDGVMRKHQLALADRQCRMAFLSQQIQDAVTILCTSLYAGARSTDEVIRAAADVLCQDLTRKLTGKPPSDRYFRTVTKLGETIADGGFQSIAGLHPDEILMPYEP
jgi:hypothetical protein